MQTLFNQAPPNTAPLDRVPAVTRDVSGYQIFSDGEYGTAHALAHRLADEGRPRLGEQLLGQWLDARSGQGSDWVHLQFHMALFELQVGEWWRAYERFLAELLPAAATTADALTDAPALLWRIAMAAPTQLSLPWEPLRRTALSCIQPSNSSFVLVHHLLALAGAGDSEGIGCWLQRTHAVGSLPVAPIVIDFAYALIDLAACAYTRAATRLHALLPHLREIGGSRAQQELFGQLAKWAARQAQMRSGDQIYRDAA